MKREADISKILVHAIIIVSASIFLLLYFPFISTLAKQDASQNYEISEDYTNPAINPRISADVILNSSQNKNPSTSLMLILGSVSLIIIVLTAFFIRKKYKEFQIEYYH